MKVLLCVHSLSGGGAETQLKLLANYIALEGVEVAIFCIDDKGVQFEHDSIRLFKISNKEKYPKETVFEIIKVLEIFKPDVIHAWLPPSITIPSMIAGAIKKVPCITSYRNRLHFDSWLRVLDWFFVLMLSKKIVSNNIIEHSAIQFRWLFTRKKGEIIPNAVCIDDIYKIPYLKRQNSTFKILFVGRLVEQKNWKTLFDALLKIDTKKQWILQVCGDGEQRVEAEIYAKNHNLACKIEFLGFRSDVHKIMSESHLLVLPSWHEGMANVALEAMATGLPCLLSDIDANRSLVKNSGASLLNDPKDVAGFACKIQKAIDGELSLSQLSERGLRLAESYDSKKMALTYKNLYKKVMSN